MPYRVGGAERRATWPDAATRACPARGGPEMRPTFETAKIELLKWSEANQKPRTHRGYRNFPTRLADSFAGCRLSEIDP